ncbi:sensor domain-containing diguanylate cyclase [Clostridium sp. ZS2-4]|uniref:sensor domain-containing diguanylate cyclase n=1 Tax=Clostridium sp. ZS2-4 TaxID=2987703 RepID=UPI00227CD331|nr:diguanylate cyclase [Clostridium sp. ZS2-4]MCY6354287.1 diguanylate cyclase [Clostridium sp. ZS2-4]
MYKNNFINEAENFFKKILQHIPLPIIVIDLQRSEIVFGNELFFKLFGYIDQDSICFNLMQLFSNSMDQKVLLNEFSRNERVHIPVKWLQKVNGQQFPAEIFLQKTSIEEKSFVIAEIIDITRRKLAEETLEKYATKDHMTDLFNRRVGLEFLEKECRQAVLGKQDLTICFIDIDGLKNVNDTYGHNTGDYLIKTVADLIKQFIGEKDIACRLGGDEFLIIFKNCNKRKAHEICYRLNYEVTKLNELNLKPYNISISYGLAEFNEIPEKSVDDFINTADKRMYDEKQKLKAKRRYAV